MSHRTNWSNVRSRKLIARNRYENNDIIEPSVERKPSPAKPRIDPSQIFPLLKDIKYFLDFRNNPTLKKYKKPSDWENTFLLSAEKQLRRLGNLTPKELNKIDSLKRKYIPGYHEAHPYVWPGTDLI